MKATHWSGSDGSEFAQQPIGRAICEIKLNRDYKITSKLFVHKLGGRRQIAGTKGNAAGMVLGGNSKSQENT
jgi:hypothetical protein